MGLQAFWPVVKLAQHPQVAQSPDDVNATNGVGIKARCDVPQPEANPDQVSMQPDILSSWLPLVGNGFLNTRTRSLSDSEYWTIISKPRPVHLQVLQGLRDLGIYIVCIWFVWCSKQTQSNVNIGLRNHPLLINPSSTPRILN